MISRGQIQVQKQTSKVRGRRPSCPRSKAAGRNPFQPLYGPRALEGDDSPRASLEGDPGAVAVRQGGTVAKTVTLTRMATEKIADRRRMFELFTEMRVGAVPLQCMHSRPGHSLHRPTLALFPRAASLVFLASAIAPLSVYTRAQCSARSR